MFALFDQKLILETTILHNVCEQWSRQKNSTNWKASILEGTKCDLFIHHTKSSFYVDIHHLYSNYLQLIKCLSNIYNLMHLTILCLDLATCVALPNICESFLYHQNKQKFSLGTKTIDVNLFGRFLPLKSSRTFTYSI